MLRDGCVFTAVMGVLAKQVYKAFSEKNAGIRAN